MRRLACMLPLLSLYALAACQSPTAPARSEGQGISAVGPVGPGDAPHAEVLAPETDRRSCAGGKICPTR